MSIRRIATLATLIVTVFVASATTASASPAPAAAQYCSTGTYTGGRAAWGACYASAPGRKFRLIVTTCGPSYCRLVRGPWWPKDGRIRSWTPGGFVARVDGVEFA